MQVIDILLHFRCYFARNRFVVCVDSLLRAPADYRERRMVFVAVLFEECFSAQKFKLTFHIRKRNAELERKLLCCFGVAVSLKENVLIKQMTHKNAPGLTVKPAV